MSESGHSVVHFVCGKCATEIVMGRKFWGKKAKCERCGSVNIVPNKDRTKGELVPAGISRAYRVRGIAEDGHERELSIRAESSLVAAALAKWQQLSVTECFEESKPAPTEYYYRTRSKEHRTVIVAMTSLLLVMLVCIWFKSRSSPPVPPRVDDSIEAPPDVSPEQVASNKLVQDFYKATGRLPSYQEFKTYRILKPAYDEQRKEDESNSDMLKALQQH